ncbi:hypothetical protein Neosp_011102 [[Neocosmospora] mangrovei]
MSDDSAHLAAMGFPSPRIPTLQPEPPTTAELAQAIQVPTMAAGTTDQQYDGRRVDLGFGQREADLGFRRQRRQHKVMQYMHNDVRRAYFAGMDDRLRNDRIPEVEAGRLADHAEEAARLAFEFLIELVSLLADPKWGYGYFTLRSRRRHEANARRARRAAMEWPKVAKMLRVAEARARTARIVALRDDFDLLRPRV